MSCNSSVIIIIFDRHIEEYNKTNEMLKTDTTYSLFADHGLFNMTGATNQFIYENTNDLFIKQGTVSIKNNISSSIHESIGRHGQT